MSYMCEQKQQHEKFSAWHVHVLAYFARCSDKRFCKVGAQHPEVFLSFSSRGDLAFHGLARETLLRLTLCLCRARLMNFLIAKIN